MIKLAGKIPPLKIKIVYEGDGDLDIYASMNTSEPHEKECQFKYLKNPQAI